jgi:hypothetical protein
MQLTNSPSLSLPQTLGQKAHTILNARLRGEINFEFIERIGNGDKKRRE